MQQIDFTGNREQEPTIFFINEKAKTIDFSQGTVRVL